MEELVKIYKVVADRNRQRIVLLLSRQNMCVCELSFVLGITQPGVSRHLKKMKQAGIIDEEKDSFWTNYSLSCGDSRSKAVIGQILKWLKNDKIVLSDLKKLRKADRTRLCCK